MRAATPTFTTFLSHVGHQAEIVHDGGPPTINNKVVNLNVATFLQTEKHVERTHGLSQ